MPKIVGVRAGSLDDPSLQRPVADIFTKSAQPWDYIPDYHNLRMLADGLGTDVAQNPDRFIAADHRKDRCDVVVFQGPVQVIGAGLRVPVKLVRVSKSVWRFNHLEAEGLFYLTLSRLIPMRNQAGMPLDSEIAATVSPPLRRSGFLKTYIPNFPRS